MSARIPQPGETVRTVIASKELEGTVVDIDSRVGINGSRDLLEVDFGESTLTISPEQLKRA